MTIGEAALRAVLVETLETPPGWTLSLGTGRDNLTGEPLTFYAGLDEFADLRTWLEGSGRPIVTLVPTVNILREPPMGR